MQQLSVPGGGYMSRDLLSVANNFKSEHFLHGLQAEINFVCFGCNLGLR